MATGERDQMDGTGAEAEGGTLMDEDGTTITTTGGECSTGEAGLVEGGGSGSGEDDKRKGNRKLYRLDGEKNVSIKWSQYRKMLGSLNKWGISQRKNSKEDVL